jgi:hypothetical protein
MHIRHTHLVPLAENLMLSRTTAQLEVGSHFVARHVPTCQVRRTFAVVTEASLTSAFVGAESSSLFIME